MDYDFGVHLMLEFLDISFDHLRKVLIVMVDRFDWVDQPIDQLIDVCDADIGE